jgi:DNA-binding transcriptional LysR family regulator
MDFRLNDLKNFVTMAYCRTITEGAAKLHITQPALTESIKRLESDMKAVLFYRTRSGIELTPSGELLIKKSKGLFESIHNLNLDPEISSSFSGRVLRIGCHTSVASYALPKFFGELQKVAPDYQIDLVHELSRNIQLKVQKGELDLGLVINPVRVPDLVIKTVAKDVVKVWASKRDQVIETVICDPELFQTQSILKKWKKSPARVISTSHLDLIARMVHQGVGVGILPERVVELTGLKLYPLNHLPAFEDELCLVHRPEFGKLEFEKITLNILKATI